MAERSHPLRVTRLRPGDDACSLRGELLVCVRAEEDVPLRTVTGCLTYAHNVPDRGIGNRVALEPVVHVDEVGCPRGVNEAGRRVELPAASRVHLELGANCN